MNGLWVSSGQVTLFFGASLLFGLFAGALFDVFRIMRIARRSFGRASLPRFLRFGDGILCFFADMIYWLMLAAAYSVFIYHRAYGRLRLGSLLCVGVGFFVWHYTLGRLMILTADRIIALVRRIVGFIISVTLKPIFCALVFLVRRLLGILYRIRTAFYHRRTLKRELLLAGRGFGIMKIKRH